MTPILLIVVAGISFLLGIILVVLIRALMPERRPSVETPPQPATPPASLRLDEVTFFKEKPGEPWLVATDGKILGNAIELSALQRQRLEELALALRAWLGYPPDPEPVQPAPTPAAAVGGYAEAFTADYPISPALEPDPAPKPAEPVPDKSIVAQIDEILQDQIAGTALSQRSIRLMELPQRGVVVAVGMNQYSDIDTVPDPEVRSAIQTAVATWERKSK